MLSPSSQKDFNRLSSDAAETPSSSKSIPVTNSSRRISVSTALKTTASSKKLPYTSSILAATRSATKSRQSVGIATRTPSDRLSVGGIVLGAHLHLSNTPNPQIDADTGVSVSTPGPTDDMENAGVAIAQSDNQGSGIVIRQLFPESDGTNSPGSDPKTNTIMSPVIPVRRKSIVSGNATTPATGTLGKKLLTPGKPISGVTSRRQSVAPNTATTNPLTSHQKSTSTPAPQKSVSSSLIQKNTSLGTPAATPARRQSLAPQATTTAKKAVTQTPSRRSLMPGALRNNVSNTTNSEIRNPTTPTPIAPENSLSESHSLDFFPEPSVTPAPSAPPSPHPSLTASSAQYAQYGATNGLLSRLGSDHFASNRFDTSISENANVSGIFDTSVSFPTEYADRRISVSSVMSDMSDIAMNPRVISPSNISENSTSMSSQNNLTTTTANTGNGSGQDRIRVMVRVRPTTDPCLRVRGDRNVLTLMEEGKKNRDYAFDSVFDTRCTQEMVFAQIGQAAVSTVTEGLATSIIAYGQTGSGKTFCQMGTPENEGLIPRCGRELMNYVDKSNGTMSLTVGYLEIYNEEVFDLLSLDDRKLTVRKNAQGSGFRADGQCHIPVTNISELLGAVSCGDQKRRVSATSQNERSSRSHAILTITLHRKDKSRVQDDHEKALSDNADEEEYVLSNPLHLVDLAGSERYHAEKGNESVHINQSLTTLATVMKNLVEGNQFINYRDSELTKLLSDSLSGKACTTLIACVHGDKANRQETISTLRFANTAKQIPVHAEKWSGGPRISRKLLEEQLKTYQTQYLELLQVQEKEIVRWTTEKEDILRVQAQLLQEKHQAEAEKIKLKEEKETVEKMKKEEHLLREMHVLPRLDSLIRKLHKVGLWNHNSFPHNALSPKFHANNAAGNNNNISNTPSQMLSVLLSSPKLSSMAALSSPSRTSSAKHTLSTPQMSQNTRVTPTYDSLMHSPLLLTPATHVVDLDVDNKDAAISQSTVNAIPAIMSSNSVLTDAVSPRNRRMNNARACFIMSSPSSKPDTHQESSSTHAEHSDSGKAGENSQISVSDALVVPAPLNQALLRTPPRRNPADNGDGNLYNATTDLLCTPTTRSHDFASPNTQRINSLLMSPTLQAFQNQENMDSQTVNMYAQFLKLLKILEYLLPHYQPKTGIRKNGTEENIPSSPFITSITSPKSGKKKNIHFSGNPFSGPFSPPRHAPSRGDIQENPDLSSTDFPASLSSPSSSYSTISDAIPENNVLRSPVVSMRKAQAKLVATVAAHHVKLRSRPVMIDGDNVDNTEVEAIRAQAESEIASVTAELEELRASSATNLEQVKLALATQHENQLQDMQLQLSRESEERFAAMQEAHQMQMMKLEEEYAAKLSQNNDNNAALLEKMQQKCTDLESQLLSATNETETVKQSLLEHQVRHQAAMQGHDKEMESLLHNHAKALEDLALTSHVKHEEEMLSKEQQYQLILSEKQQLLTAKEQIITALEEAVSEKDKLNASLTMQLETSTLPLAAQTEQNTMVLSSETEMKTALMTATAAAAAAATEILELKKLLSTTQSTVSDLQTELHSQQGLVEKYREQLCVVEAQRAMHEESTALLQTKLEQEQSRLMEEINEWKTKLEELNNTVSELEQQREHMQSEMEMKEAVSEQLRQDMEKKMTTIEAMACEREEISAQAAEMTQKYQVLDENYKVLVDEHRSLMSRCEALVSERNELLEARQEMQRERDVIMMERDTLMQTVLQARSMATAASAAGDLCHANPSAVAGDADLLTPAITSLRNELSACARHAAEMEKKLRESDEKREKLRKQAMMLCRSGALNAFGGEFDDVNVGYSERVHVDSDLDVDTGLNISTMHFPVPRNTNAQNMSGSAESAVDKAASSTVTAVSVSNNVKTSHYTHAAKFAAELRCRREKARRLDMLEDQGWW